MTVIQLLNKIANGEEVPKRIMYRGVEWVYNDRQYYRVDGEQLRNIWSGYNFNILDDEVEIIEEDKKIEKIEYIVDEDGILFIDGFDDGREQKLQIAKKINEIIDKLNEMENE